MRMLKFIGVDSWGRPVYEDQNGKFWKDVNLGRGVPDLNDSDSFDGEPGWPIEGEFKISSD